MGIKPKARSLKIFSCLYETVTQKKKKLEDRSRSGLFLRYLESFCYKIWDIEKEIVIMSRNIKFNEENLNNNSIKHLNSEIKEEKDSITDFLSTSSSLKDGV